MKKIIYIIILSIFLLNGCTEEEILGSKCGTVSPDSRDECCERKMVDKPHDECEGRWRYWESDSENECAWVCGVLRERRMLEECEEDSDCKVGGCNGEICSKEPLAGICLYKPEFECYKQIDCKCTNGGCGWEKTEEFEECFKQKQE